MATLPWQRARTSSRTLDHVRHFLGDDRFDAVDQFRIFEILGDLAQRLRRGLRADEIDLDPRDAEFLLHHLGHVVDRAVAHDAVEIGRVGVGELVVAGVAAEGGDHV